MTTHLTSSQLDIVKALQSVDEGVLSTVANFGKTITDPAFIQAGYNPDWNYEDQPVGVTVRTVGTKSRDQEVIVESAGLLHIDTGIVDIDLLSWLLNPTTSKTFMYSYLANGVELYRILKACLPKKVTISVPNKKDLQVSADIMVFKPQDEATSDYTIGGGSHADPLTGTPYTHANSGSGPLIYDGNPYFDKGFTCSVDYGFQLLDPNGDLQVQWAKPSLTTVTGSITIFKKDKAIQNDVGSLVGKDVSRVLVASVATLNLTNLNFKTHKYKSNRGASDSTMEDLNYEANSVELA